MTLVERQGLTLPGAVTPAIALGSTRRSVAAGTATTPLTGTRRLELWMLTITWVVALGGFWLWWFTQALHGPPLMLVLGTVPLAYVSTALPSFYWFFVHRAKVPEARRTPIGMRVAVITPCVPSSESTDVVEGQLAALAALTYPCDAWLLDEGNRPELRELCRAYGVRHFSRLGHPEWNEPGPPFQAKTKAGNVNAWIDHVLETGIEYDVFVQLDIDHRPVPGYLEHTLGHFDDPSVGWVQAPSVCGNLQHWTARGQAEQETALQGPLQMGFFGHSRTPFIIGSHTSYRMSAICEIGGYQPTRAEDHLDTVVLAAHGYRGVYVPEIIATGDGPETFDTYLGQQFAWAYSMAQIFLRHTPKLLRRYEAKQAFQFLMAQSWYTLWSVSCVVLWALPIVSLLTGLPVVSVRPSDFLIHYLPMLATATLMWWWSRFLFQPRHVGLTWRWFVLEGARWPIVLWAVVNAALRVQRPYMITPKGSTSRTVAPGHRLYGPYLLLAWVAIAAIAVAATGSTPSQTSGNLFLVALGAASSLGVMVVAASLEVRDLRRTGGWAAALQARGGTMVMAAITFGALVTGLVACSGLLSGSVG